MGIDVEAQISINRGIDKVAEFACDPLNAPRWSGVIEHAAWVTAPPLQIGSLIAFQASVMGRSLNSTYEVVEFLPHERLVMATAEGPFPMETTYRWQMLGQTSTRMVLRIRSEPPGLSRLTRPLLQSAVRTATTSDLSALRDLLESSD